MNRKRVNPNDLPRREIDILPPKNVLNYSGHLESKTHLKYKNNVFVFFSLYERIKIVTKKISDVNFPRKQEENLFRI